MEFKFSKFNESDATSPLGWRVAGAPPSWSVPVLYVLTTCDFLSAELDSLMGLEVSSMDEASRGRIRLGICANVSDGGGLEGAVSIFKSSDTA